jgi:hypothetical protein
MSSAQFSRSASRFSTSPSNPVAIDETDQGNTYEETVDLVKFYWMQPPFLLQGHKEDWDVTRPARPTSPLLPKGTSPRTQIKMFIETHSEARELILVFVTPRVIKILIKFLKL